MKQHQTLDREERAAWRDAQKLYAEEEKNADEIWMAKTEADKELTLKEMKLKAQTQASSIAAIDSPPHNR